MKYTKGKPAKDAPANVAVLVCCVGEDGRYRSHAVAVCEYHSVSYNDGPPVREQNWTRPGRYSLGFTPDRFWPLPSERG